MSLGEFLKIFVVALVSLMSSNWDIWSDGLMWHEYYFGTIYEYYFINQSHPSIGELNCTAIGGKYREACHTVYTIKYARKDRRSNSARYWDYQRTVLEERSRKRERRSII